MQFFVPQCIITMKSLSPILLIYAHRLSVTFQASKAFNLSLNAFYHLNEYFFEFQAILLHFDYQE